MIDFESCALSNGGLSLRLLYEQGNGCCEEFSRMQDFHLPLFVVKAQVLVLVIFLARMCCRDEIPVTPSTYSQECHVT